MQQERPGGNDRGYLSDGQINETRVVVHNNLRHVLPYNFVYESMCKQRWIGRSVLDVFVEEFVGQTRADYERSIEAGRIRVNGNRVTADYRLKDGDKTTHQVHRHEPACSAQPIGLVAHDNELLICNKPPSIPVHPSGRYRHQTLQYLLAREFGLRRVACANRLDRLTSGIVVCSTDARTAETLRRLVMSRSVRKNYLAVASGNMMTLLSTASTSASSSSPNLNDGWLHCDAPIVVLQVTQGICSVGPDGLSSFTSFKPLHYDAEFNTTLVLCIPLTGRTHQIRVHLKHLGHPIADDPLYQLGGEIRPSRPVLSDGRASKRALWMDSTRTVAPFEPHHQQQQSVGQKRTISDLNDSNNNVNDDNGDDDVNRRKKIGRKDNDSHVSTTSTKIETTSEKSTKNNDELPDSMKSSFVEYCGECINPFVEPLPSELSIYLHALRYTFKRPTPISTTSTSSTTNSTTVTPISKTNIDSTLTLTSHEMQMLFGDRNERTFETPLPPWPIFKNNENVDFLTTIHDAIKDFDERIAPTLPTIVETKEQSVNASKRRARGDDDE